MAEVTFSILEMPSSKGGAFTASAPHPQRREHYLDWVRALVVALVLVFHTIDVYFDYTYSAAVYLGIVNKPPHDASRPAALVAAQLVQSWFMGAMFLISGLLSSPSLAAKGAARFVAGRAARLLLPLAAYELLLQPLAFQIARGSAHCDPAIAAATSGFAWHFSGFRRVGHGASWFLAVLFMFDLAFAAAHGTAALWRCRGRPAPAAAAPEWCAGAAPPPLPSVRGDSPAAAAAAPKGCAGAASYPVAASLAAGATAALLLAGLTLLVRGGALYCLGLPIGMWQITGIQFQPGYLPQYALAFCLGIAAARAGTLARLPTAVGAAAGAAAAALAAGGGAALVLLPGSNFGREMDAAPSLLYVVFFSVWEAFYAVAAWLAVLVAFRDLANVEGGRAGAAVSGASYAAYILHVPILTALTLGFEPFAMHPAAKCFVVMPLLVACTWSLAVLLRFLPGVKRIL